MPEAQGAQAWQPAPEPWWPQPRGPRRPLDAAWTAAHAPPRAAARRPRGPWAWVTLVPAVASGPRGQQVLHASELPRLRTLPGGWGWGASRPAPCRGRSEPPPTAHTLPRANPDLRKRPRGRRGSRPHSVTPREDSVPAPRGSASRRSRTRAWTCSAGRLSGSSSHPSPSGLGAAPRALPGMSSSALGSAAVFTGDPPQQQHPDQDQTSVLPARRAGPSGPQFSSEASGLQPGSGRVMTGVQG